MSLILVTKQTENFPQNEIDELLTSEGIKSIIPNESVFISSDCSLKIEGLRVCSIEYITEGHRMDKSFFSYNLNYFFIMENYSVSVQFMVANKLGESHESVHTRYNTIKLVFYKMFNSLVIDNIWL